MHLNKNKGEIMKDIYIFLAVCAGIFTASAYYDSKLLTQIDDLENLINKRTLINYKIVLPTENENGDEIILQTISYAEVNEVLETLIKKLKLELITGEPTSCKIKNLEEIKE